MINIEDQHCLLNNGNRKHEEEEEEEKKTTDHCARGDKFLIESFTWVLEVCSRGTDVGDNSLFSSFPSSMLIALRESIVLILHRCVLWILKTE